MKKITKKPKPLNRCKKEERELDVKELTTGRIGFRLKRGFKLLKGFAHD